MLYENFGVHKEAYYNYLRRLEETFSKGLQSEISAKEWKFLDFPEEFFEEEMTIWIDPLDGTKGFVEGHIHHITGMIGVSVKGRPRIGVIHKPFYNMRYHHSRTYFGTPECGIFIKDKFHDKLDRLRKYHPLPPFPHDFAVPDEDFRIWSVGSMNRNQVIMNEIYEAMQTVNVARVAGSGNKWVYMLDQKADAYINMVPGLKFWDLCAGEALLQSRMGVLTDASGNAIFYDESLEDYTPRNGIIACKNLRTYNIMKERIEKNTGKSLMQHHALMAEEIARKK